MDLSQFIKCLLVLILCIVMFRFAFWREYPRGANIKKVEIKHFHFLFGEGTRGIDLNSNEVSLIVLIIQIIGYMINISAVIALVICYCYQIDIAQYIVYLAIGELIGIVVCLIAVIRMSGPTL